MPWPNVEHSPRTSAQERSRHGARRCIPRERTRLQPRASSTRAAWIRTPLSPTNGRRSKLVGSIDSVEFMTVVTQSPLTYTSSPESFDKRHQLQPMCMATFRAAPSMDMNGTAPTRLKNKHMTYCLAEGIRRLDSEFLRQGSAMTLSSSRVFGGNQ